MTAFFKLSGSGNDFLALAEPASDPSPEQVRAWCRRGVSEGADGVFVLRRSGAGVVAMSYHNADGTTADLCLNGTRCAARLAFTLGWARDAVTVATGCGPLAARALGDDRIEIEVPPADAPPERLELAAEGRRWVGWRVVVGVPHLVVPWPEGLAAAPVATAGRALRQHPDLAPAGANVDFVRFPDPRRLEIRTYERGVEAETLACGTGVLAAAAVGLARGDARLPLTAITAGGFELTVDGDPASAVHRWSLAGDARLVTRGELLPAAEAAPAPPVWS
jgi:diaminopimelate epimerase